MVYLKIGDTYYPASFFKTTQDGKWGNRASMAITVTMSYQEAVSLFVDGLRWSHVVQNPAYADMDGNLITPDPIITDYSEYEMAGPITDNRDGTITAKMGCALSGECNAALTGDSAALTVREATALRGRMETMYQLAAPSMTADEVIENRVMCKAWAAGSHTAGEVYEANGQIWQCIQGYDNEEHPDVVPGGSDWGTFHKPYHGTTKEIAMPWVEPTAAHDMYQTGEYMVWTDGLVYKCLSGTSYGPGDYADAWEVQE